MKIIRKLACILLITGAPLLFGYFSPNPEKGQRPNFVLIFSDDLGWTGLGSFGSEFYETPNIDKLAEGGMVFTQGYAGACVCAPSRGMLISGQYSPRNGTLRVTNVPKRDKNQHLYKSLQPDNKPFSRELLTIAEALKSGGYKTAMFGKWHLGPGMPGDHGFDTWIESHGAHFNFRTSPDIEVPEGVYLTDFMTDNAIKFIKNNVNNPFFLYLPDFLVHKPHEAKKELIEKYRKKEPHGFHRDPVYAAMTESLDNSVGRIFNTLKENNLLVNTLIVFTSDNGAACGMDNNFNIRANSFTDNLPLRAGKGTMYEGGLRVPYIFYWKGRIEPGTSSEEQIINLDLYPTFLDLAGIEAPDSHILDGISIAGLIMNKETDLEERPVFWHYPNYGPARVKNGKIVYSNIPTDVVRLGDYKLLEFYHDKPVRHEMYNIREDIGERHNLVEKQPGKKEELLKILNDWRKETGARMPVANKDFDMSLFDE